MEIPLYPDVIKKKKSHEYRKTMAHAFVPAFCVIRIISLIKGNRGLEYMEIFWFPEISHAAPELLGLPVAMWDN